MKWIDKVWGGLKPLEYDNVYIQPLHETVACHWLFNMPNISRLQLLSLFCSQLVNQSLSSALLVVPQHCLFNWHTRTGGNTNQYRFFNYNSYIFCKCLWSVLTRSNRLHVIDLRLNLKSFTSQFILLGWG